MTLATRCPACGTVFRVVQDQLRVSEGWVRCGRCGEAFNGVESMVPWPPSAPEAPPDDAAPQSSPTGAFEPVVESPPPAAEPASESTSSATGEISAEPQQQDAPSADAAVGPPADDAAIHPSEPEEAAGAQAPSPARDPETPPFAEPAAPETQAGAEVAEGSDWAGTPSTGSWQAPMPIAPEDGAEFDLGETPEMVSVVTPHDDDALHAPGMEADATVSGPATPEPAIPEAPAQDPAEDIGPVRTDEDESGSEVALEIPPDVELIASDGAMRLDLPPPDADRTHAPGEASPADIEAPRGDRIEPEFDIAATAAQTAARADAIPSPLEPELGISPPALAEAESTEGESAEDPAPEITVEPTASAAPSFVQQADRAARWQRPTVRAGLAAFSLLAVLTLAAQFVHTYRDYLAVSLPQARPWLQQACAILGCRIEPYRRIDGLSVESSGLSRVEGSSVYRLAVTLRNRAEVEVAAPALELSLTDVQGDLIARRVMSMSDLGLPLRSLKPGSVLPIAAPLTIDGQVSGYTVEIFYP